MINLDLTFSLRCGGQRKKLKTKNTYNYDEEFRSIDSHPIGVWHLRIKTYGKIAITR